ncbi:hypothetical protein CLCR_11052 [Cladophialophora carrionii]|uniref:Uncharacterized protein n=1 Tax=Cladophialophora carrionii TaxID=86049 RepID=A0A1C1CXI7_9EURO|nr:hypothetical protein CLCR_11052 [Cladophialophora carrionii]
MGSIHISAPTFEQHHDGFGVMSPTPRISWRFSFSNRSGFDWQQDGYEVEIAFESTEKAFTFKVDSHNSVLEPWPARPLTSGEEARLRVRCYGSSANAGEHSQDQRQ